MRSTSSAFAVSMRIGMCDVAVSPFKILQTSSPDIFGNIRSRMMKSGRLSRAFCKPVAPSAAVVVLNPALCKPISRRSATSLSSSMIRIFRPELLSIDRNQLGCRSNCNPSARLRGTASTVNGKVCRIVTVSSYACNYRLPWPAFHSSTELFRHWAAKETSMSKAAFIMPLRVRWRRKPSECAQQRILCLVVVGDDVEVIIPGARQVLFGQDRLENNADTKFFALLSETQSFCRIGERLLCRRDLVGERPDTRLAGDDLVRHLIDHLVGGESGTTQARLPGVNVAEIE